MYSDTSNSPHSLWKSTPRWIFRRNLERFGKVQSVSAGAGADSIAPHLVSPELWNP
jgi:hypothetical protein